MSQSIREFMGIGAQGIGASEPVKKPGLRETFKEFFKKDNLKRAMIPRTISQGVSGFMDVYNRGRLPGESKMSLMDLARDDSRQITVSDEDFKAGKTGIKNITKRSPLSIATGPFKAFTPKMLATGPTPAVRQAVERVLGPVGALTTAGQVGYGVGNILMDVTGTRDDVSAAGAALANTQIGQQLAGALGVPQTPNVQSQTPSPQQGIAATSVANPNLSSVYNISGVPGGGIPVPLGFETTHGYLFDEQGNLFRESNPDSFYRAQMSGKGSLGPRDFYVSEGYIQNPLVRGPAGMGMKAIPLESFMDPMLQRENSAPIFGPSDISYTQAPPSAIFRP